MTLHTFSRRAGLHCALAAAAATSLWAMALGTSTGAHAQPANWASVEQAAKGQTVYFNAWGGGERINAYIRWVADQVQTQYGVNLVHVKVADIAETIGRVRGEIAAGKTTGGTADLLWVNGENFATLKREGLLFGPFAQALPNFAFVDTTGKPTTLKDFGETTDGLESPWGMAQLTFYADKALLPVPPRNAAELAQLAAQQPGRITYPRLPAFHGTTFVKQLLLELTPNRAVLDAPVTDTAFAQATKPLWAYLDALHPHLWRGGKQFPTSIAQISQGVSERSLLLGMTFNPTEASAEVVAGKLPSTTYSYQHTKGTIGNTHFVAIPKNANAPAGAQVVANFLLSPQAQARKADIRVWGDPTVLDIKALDAAGQAAFAQASAGSTGGALTVSGPTLGEPHASWVGALEKAWVERYGQ
ncbi:MAG: ABC transporter substrate-binding protein [Burkholderiaceae bacterium]|nr:ABC transporter substrate-binding protein [Burkholderiaceae bacterium]